MNRFTRSMLLAAFFISGSCGLLYEIVWGRLLGFVFGSSMLAITTVVTCFMGGLALGSYAGGHISRRARNPARLYGWIELVIGGFCLAVPWLMDMAIPAYRRLYAVAEQSPALLTLARILLSSAILVVPTTLMGATLPLLASFFARDRRGLGTAAGLLYGLNTLGALLGCIAAGFFLLPLIGLTNTIRAAAALNVLAGMLALRVTHPSGDTLVPDMNLDRPPPSIAASEPLAPATPARFRLRQPELLLAYALCGFASMACQVAWTRALILVMGASTYAFSTVVACFIAGMALGSLLMTAWLPRVKQPLAWAGTLAAAGSVATLAVIPLFSLLPDMVARLSSSINPSFFRILATEIGAAFGILAIPTLCMGALLPLVCSISAGVAAPPSSAHPAGETSGPDAGRLMGNVYAANTIGSILGTAMAGFVFIPWSFMGMQRTIMLSALITGLVATRFLLALPPSLAVSPPRRRRQGWLLAVVWLGLLAVVALTPPWTRRWLTAGPYMGRGMDSSEYLIYYREGTDCTVTVSETHQTDKVLRINGKPDASTRTADMYTQTLFGVLPISLRPQARSVCIIGFGSGVTAGAVLASSDIATVDMAEISDAVLDAAPWFADANGDVLRNPRFKLHRTDGRNLLLLSPRQYDIIISEPSNPWLSGIANLFSREFLEISRSRLGASGMHCQWIHSYSMHPDDFSAVLKTMASVFPFIQVWSMWHGDYLVVGSQAPIRLDMDSWKALFDRPASAAVLRRIMITRPLNFAHHYVAEGVDLAPLFQDCRTLVDDRPHLEFSAPRYLLSNWGLEIGAALDGLSGVNPPFVPGEDPRLVAEFKTQLQNARRSRQFLRDSVDAARHKDSRRYLDDYESAAAATPEDGRVFLLILPELHRRMTGARPEVRATLERYIRRISSLTPLISSEHSKL